MIRKNHTLALKSSLRDVGFSPLESFSSSPSLSLSSSELEPLNFCVAGKGTLLVETLPEASFLCAEPCAEERAGITSSESELLSWESESESDVAALAAFGLAAFGLPFCSDVCNFEDDSSGDIGWSCVGAKCCERTGDFVGDLNGDFD